LLENFIAIVQMCVDFVPAPVELDHGEGCLLQVWVENPEAAQIEWPFKPVV
jgi:hypothetical protein